MDHESALKAQEHGDEERRERDIAASEVTSVPVEQTPSTVEEEYHEEEEEEEPLRRPEPVFLFIEPVVASLVLFSMLGVLVRIYLTRLFTYHGTPIYALIWTQMLGCLVMGVATRTKGVLLRLSPALNLGVTTGLCGSITTFSSWQLLVFTQFFNTARDGHSHFRNFLGGMSVLVTTLACSVGALRMGQMLGDEARLLCGVYLRHRGDTIFRVDTGMLGGGPPAEGRGWREWRTTDHILSVAGTVGVCAACVVVGLATRTRSVSIALLFGPVGTMVRWRLAALNTKHIRCAFGLPLGTFTANVVGSLVLAIVHILQTGVVVRPSQASCYVLQAVADGFCGCLTTISTFVAEIHVLSSRRSIIYAVLSVVVTQAFFILIPGIYFKTADVDYNVCL
ncbi:hypothetical protein IWW50_003254 [Coemansia erecta]|nr:hypothetical protein IWW50_003254 [Coemansia erecta]